MLNKILIAVIIICSILLIGILLIVFVFNHSTGTGQEAPCSCTEDLDCVDFATHEAAQACFEFCGGTSNDFHRLDSDGNGLACESLE